MSLKNKAKKLWDQYLISQRVKELRDFAKSNTHGQHVTKEEEKRIRALFEPYFPVDLSFHNFFYEKVPENRAINYIPDEIHYNYVDAYFNDWREANYADNKCFYPRMFQGIRHPDTLAYRMNGMWFVGDYQPVTREQMLRVLAEEPEIVVKKAMGSEGGLGVFFVKGTEFPSVEGRIRDDIVIQRPIVQHPQLSAVNPTSINTIRILSLLSEDGVKLYSAVLRIGTGGARVDNGTSGGISCGITWEGRLKKYAYLVCGDRCDVHPDTGLVFEGHAIPSFDKCMELVPKLHWQVPRFRMISWDFSVNPEGEPVLVEANLHYGGIEIHQLNNGPLFGEDTEKILKEVFGKK